MKRKIILSLLLIAVCLSSACGSKKEENIRFEMSIDGDSMKLPTTLNELEKAGWEPLYEVTHVESNQEFTYRLKRNQYLMDVVLINNSNGVKSTKECNIGIFVINYDEYNNPNFELKNGLKLNKKTKTKDIRKNFGTPTEEVKDGDDLTLFYSEDSDTSYIFDFTNDFLNYVRIENRTKL